MTFHWITPNQTGAAYTERDTAVLHAALTAEVEGNEAITFSVRSGEQLPKDVTHIQGRCGFCSPVNMLKHVCACGVLTGDAIQRGATTCPGCKLTL